MINQIGDEQSVNSLLLNVAILGRDSVAKHYSNTIDELRTVPLNRVIEMLLNRIKINPTDLSVAAEMGVSPEQSGEFMNHKACAF